MLSKAYNKILDNKYLDNKLYFFTLIYRHKNYNMKKNSVGKLENF